MTLEELELGMHGNRECVRCGACCVFFEILDDTFEAQVGLAEGRVIKEAGEICPYLEYDKGIATCRIYASEERPLSCQNGFCGSGRFFDHKGLGETARMMGSYFKEG